RKKAFGRKQKTKRKGNREYADYHSSKWSEIAIFRAGTWAQKCLINALPKVFACDEFGLLYVLPSGRKRIAKAVYESMGRNPKMLPSTGKPEPWTGFREGAFWSEQSELSAPAVRTRHKKVERIIRKAWDALQPHVNAMNSQQSVAWMIDDKMAEVVSHFG